VTAGALRASGDGLLRACLERALTETRGAPTVVADMTRRPFAYETSFAIDEIDVQLADGDRLALLAKDVGGAGLSAAATDAKPSSLIDPAREIAVYRDVLGPAGLSTPRFHGASVDEGEGRWWLFLERVDGEVLTDVGELAVWEEAAAWAARLDSAVGDRPAATEGRLVQRDSGWHRGWIDAAVAVVDHPLASRLRTVSQPLVDRLDALPQAFVHGELYPSNVVVERGRIPPRIAPVDWELAGTGPYALDLAALVSGWSSEDRLSMCRAFHRSLPQERRTATSFDGLLEAVALCRVSLALQWIGWAPGWEAPEAHRHDWVSEAAELLDEVGLR
jgi:Ser/Thr protein kinase RdoA (MazF antagonist)